MWRNNMYYMQDVHICTLTHGGINTGLPSVTSNPCYWHQSVTKYNVPASGAVSTWLMHFLNAYQLQQIQVTCNRPSICNHDSSITRQAQSTITNTFILPCSMPINHYIDYNASDFSLRLIHFNFYTYYFMQNPALYNCITNFLSLSSFHEIFLCQTSFILICKTNQW